MLQYFLLEWLTQKVARYIYYLTCCGCTHTNENEGENGRRKPFRILFCRTMFPIFISVFDGMVAGVDSWNVK